MKKSILFFCFISLIFGIILFAFHHEWIVIRLPQIGKAPSTQPIKTIKKVTLLFWHDDKWHTEEQKILWDTDLTTNLSTLINSWLTTLEEESLLVHKISLESIISSPSGNDTYISFDRSPFQKEWSTHQKWLWIESLLKTIRENHLPVQKIYFLVHHKPLQDSHLSFGHPWPISGFLAR